MDTSGVEPIGKSPEQVRRAWDAADDPDAFFLTELGDFFAPDAANEAQRLERVSDVLERLDTERDEFLGSFLEPDDVIAVDVIVTRGGPHPVWVTTYREVPTPTVLFEMLAISCDTGDVVDVNQRLACGDMQLRSAVWPFGMDTAAALTAPAPEEVDPDGSNTARAVLAVVKASAPTVMSAAALVAAGVALFRRRR